MWLTDWALSFNWNSCFHASMQVTNYSFIRCQNFQCKPIENGQVQKSFLSFTDFYFTLNQLKSFWNENKCFRAFKVNAWLSPNETMYRAIATRILCPAYFRKEDFKYRMREYTVDCTPKRMPDFMYNKKNAILPNFSPIKIHRSHLLEWNLNTIFVLNETRVLREFNISEVHQTALIIAKCKSQNYSKCYLKYETNEERKMSPVNICYRVWNEKTRKKWRRK